MTRDTTKVHTDQSTKTRPHLQFITVAFSICITLSCDCRILLNSTLHSAQFLFLRLPRDPLTHNLRLHSSVIRPPSSKEELRITQLSTCEEMETNACICILFLALVPGMGELQSETLVWRDRYGGGDVSRRSGSTRGLCVLPGCG